MSFFGPDSRDAERALKNLGKVKIPKGGDVDGLPLNSPELLRLLPSQTRENVLDDTEVLINYFRKDGDFGPEPNRRSLNAMNRKGYDVSLHPDQYDPTRLVGRAGNGNYYVDIGDPSTEEDSD